MNNTEGERDRFNNAQCARSARKILLYILVFKRLNNNKDFSEKTTLRIRKNTKKTLSVEFNVQQL